MLTLIDYTLYEALPFGFMALGLVLTFRYLKLIDLTFAASFALGPAVLARLLVEGHAFAFALSVAVVLTGSLSLLTLFLLLVLRVDGLLAGLISSFAGYALSLLFTRGTLSFGQIDTPLTWLLQRDLSWFSGRAPLHPWQIGVFAAGCLAAKWATDVFLRSEAGLAYRALEDEKSARNLLPSLRISPDRLTAAGVLAGNLLCMFSGVIVALKETQATAQRGFDALLTVIAAYLLGVTLFEKRPTAALPPGTFGHSLGRIQCLEATSAPLVGLILYFALLQGISRLDVPSSVPKLIVVSLLVLSFTVSRWDELRRRLIRAAHDVTIPAAPGDALVAEEVCVSYPAYPQPIRALEGASLRVAPGELVHLIGGNGTGKSTLLRYLAGEIAGRGRVVVPGAETVGNGAVRRGAVALIPQDSGLATCSTLTPREHFALYLKGNRASSIRRWSKVLSEGIDAPKQLGRLLAFGDVPVACLSGGQRQILNVTSLMVRPNAPRIALFDEPLTYLDEANAQVCVELIGELMQLGCAIVLVQHDLDPPTHFDEDPDHRTRARLAAIVTRRVDISDLRAPLPDRAVS